MIEEISSGWVIELTASQTEIIGTVICQCLREFDQPECFQVFRAYFGGAGSETAPGSGGRPGVARFLVRCSLWDERLKHTKYLPCFPEQFWGPRLTDMNEITVVHPFIFLETDTYL